MKIEFDPVRDLLYLYFSESGAKAVETKIISPGIHADFSGDGKLMGIEIIDASEIIGRKIEFAFPETALLQRS